MHLLLCDLRSVDHRFDEFFPLLFVRLFISFVSKYHCCCHTTKTNSKVLRGGFRAWRKRYENEGDLIEDKQDVYGDY
jgi:hypothetical protein